MQTFKKYLVLTVIAVAIVGAQIVNPSGSTVTGAVNNAGATSTRPMREVVGDPSGACSVNGEVVSNPANAKLFKCVAGTWTEIAGSGGGGATANFGWSTSTNTVAAGGTTYTGAGLTTFNSDESQRSMIAPIAATSAYLALAIGSGQPASGAVTCTLRVNYADDADVSVVVPAGTAAPPANQVTVFSDSGAVSIAAGDALSVKCVNAASDLTAQLRSWTLRLSN